MADCTCNNFPASLGNVSFGASVGIGTTTPVTRLHVRQDATSTLGPILTLMNGAGGGGAACAVDFDGYDPGSNPPSARIQSVDDGNFSSHFVVLIKTPGANANGLVERLRLNSDGT